MRILHLLLAPIALIAVLSCGSDPVAAPGQDAYTNSLVEEMRKVKAIGEESQKATDLESFVQFLRDGNSGYQERLDALAELDSVGARAESLALAKTLEAFCLNMQKAGQVVVDLAEQDSGSITKAVLNEMMDDSDRATTRLLNGFKTFERDFEGRHGFKHQGFKEFMFF